MANTNSDRSFIVNSEFEDFNIVEFARAVESRYEDDDEPIVIYCSLLPIICNVVRILEYKNREYRAILSMKENLADLIIGSVRLRRMLPLKKRVKFPSSDTLRVHLSGFDWSNFALRYGTIFIENPYDAFMSFSHLLVDMVDDTALDFGFRYRELLDMALRRVIALRGQDHASES